jgi:tetratricopeptide (TPR) repeat protein
MTDLANIVKSKVDKLSSQNIALAAEKCNQADNLVMEVRSTGGKDKNLVNQALNLYKESLELNSRQIQPYIGIAYITYSAGDVKQAVGFLNKAEQIDPDNESVKEMLQLFKNEVKSSVISKAANKTLSERFKTDNNRENNIFAKITSIFMNSSKKKNAANPFISTAYTTDNTSDKTQAGPAKSSGNFFENIKNSSANKPN